MLKFKPTAFVTAGIMVSASMLLTGCSERTTTASVTGVNYTDANIAGFQVIQPDNFDNRSPTQEAMAYGAGGQMCCYVLPYNWHEGLKIELKVEPDIDLPISNGQYQHEYDKRRDEGRLYQYVEVNISRYEPGKAQLLWIQFLPNNQYRASATDIDPTNPIFPSDMKGWPVPSVAFRHKLWEQEIDKTQDAISRLNKAIVTKNNEDEWKERWDIYKEYTKIIDQEKNNFKGYDDISFRRYTENNYRKGYDFYLKRLEKLKNIEPK